MFASKKNKIIQNIVLFVTLIPYIILVYLFAMSVFDASAFDYFVAKSGQYVLLVEFFSLMGAGFPLYLFHRSKIEKQYYTKSEMEEIYGKNFKRNERLTAIVLVAIFTLVTLNMALEANNLLLFGYFAVSAVHKFVFLRSAKDVERAATRYGLLSAIFYLLMLITFILSAVFLPCSPIETVSSAGKPEIVCQSFMALLGAAYFIALVVFEFWFPMRYKELKEVSKRNARKRIEKK